MGGVASKLDPGSTMVGYLVLNPEPGLSQVRGVWEDPSAAFRGFGVTDQMPVTPAEMATLSCLSWGLNPHAPGMAVGRSGNFNLRSFALAIWQAATLSERRKISIQLTSKLDLSVATWDPPHSFARKVVSAVSRAKVQSGKKRKLSPQVWVADALIVASRIVTGTKFCLTDGAGMTRSIGYGHVLTAPRGISILYALSNADIREQIMEFLAEATREALTYYQRYAGRTRARISGAVRDVQCHYAAVQYRHVTARPVTLSGDELKMIPADALLGKYRDTVIDPHLHSHLFIPNLVRDLDGHFRALESRYLLIARKGAEATFEASLAHRLKEHFGLSSFIDPDRKVGFAVKEISPLLVKNFAHRKVETDKYWAAEYGADPGHSDSIFDKSSARLATRRRKEMFSFQELDRHWQVRGEVLGLGPARIDSFLQACRSSFGKDIGEKKILDADALIALVDRKHRETETTAVREENIRFEVLHEYFGLADGKAILDACDAAMQQLVFLGVEAKRKLYASPNYCLFEKQVLDLAEQTFPARNLLANLGLTERQILAVDPAIESTLRAASEVLSGNARARYLEGPDDLDRDLILNRIQEIVRSKGLQFLNVVAGDSGTKQMATGTQPLAELLDSIRNMTFNVHKAVLILGNANSVAVHEMHELIHACKRSNLLLIVHDSPSQRGGLFSRMLHNRKHGSGIHRQISQRFQDPDDNTIAEMLRNGQAKCLWENTRLADKLVFAEASDEAIESLALKFVSDRRDFPHETQLIVAISEATMKQIRQAVEQRCKESGLPLPATHEIMSINKTDGCYCDRSYVLTEGQDQWEQIICRTRHRKSCYQVASIRSLYNWLLDMTDDDPSVTLDGVRQAAFDILACQWSLHRYKSTTADAFDDLRRLAILPILASSAFTRKSKNRLSAERLKIASHELQASIKQKPEQTRPNLTRVDLINGYLANLEVTADLAQLPTGNLRRYLHAKAPFWDRVRPKFQTALRTLMNSAQAIDINLHNIPPPSDLRPQSLKGPENDLQRIHVATAGRMVDQGALVAIDRARRQAAYKRGCNPGIH